MVEHCIRFSICSPLNASIISKVRNRLLLTYDKEAIPIETSFPLNVSVDIQINDMVPVDNSDMHFSIDAYFRVTWTDYRLQFNDSLSNTFIPIEYQYMDLLWIPDLYFPQSKSGHIHSLMQKNAVAYLWANGSVVTSQRISVNSFCDMDYTYYPFDIQECKLSVQSYTFSSLYIDLIWFGKGVTYTNDLHTVNFNAVKITLNRSSADYQRFGKFNSLDINFRLFRNLKLYLLRDFFPSILLVCLSWVSFWINHRSTPARVAFGVTTVLTVVTLTNNVKETSPPSSIFRSIDYYLLICKLYVFGALAECAIVGMSLPVSKRRRCYDATKITEGYEDGEDIEEYEMKNTKSLSHVTLATLENGYSSHNGNKQESFYRMSKGRRPSLITGLLPQPKQQSKAPRLLHYSRNAHFVDRVSRVLFPFSFILINVVFFLYHRLHPDTVD